jgi:hypothetical protein
MAARIKGKNMNTIEVTLRGANLQEIAKQAQLLFGTTTTATAPVRQTPTTKKAAAEIESDFTLDEVAETEVETETTDEVGFDLSADEDDTETPAPVKTKAKKYTEKDLQTAAKNHAKVYGRPKTQALLTKKFKVKSLLELKPDQFASVIETLKV